MVAAPEGCARKRDPRRTPDFLVAAGDRRDLFRRRPNENNRDRCAWVFRARYIGVQIFKTSYQAYYNDLNPEGLEAVGDRAVRRGSRDCRRLALRAGSGFGTIGSFNVTWSPVGLATRVHFRCLSPF